jgi:hypothetical protein
MSPKRIGSRLFIALVVAILCLFIGFVVYLFNDPTRGLASNRSEANAELRDINRWIERELTATSTTPAVAQLFDKTQAPYLRMLPKGCPAEIVHGNGRIDDPFLRGKSEPNFYRVGVLANGIWWSQSIGPDRQESVAESELKAWNSLPAPDDAYAAITTKIYDATNGTFSNGDIIRVGDVLAFH